MNKKSMTIILVISHLLCTVLGYCIASIQIKNSEPTVDTIVTTELILTESIEETVPTTEEIAETEVEITEETIADVTEAAEELEENTPPTEEQDSPVYVPVVTTPPTTQPPVTEPPVTTPTPSENPAPQPGDSGGTENGAGWG